MSASDDTENPTGGEDHGPPTPWYDGPGGVALLIIVICFGAYILIYIIGGLLDDAIKKRRAKSRQPVDDGHELVERRETVEGPRKSEESIGTCYESEKPVENNAKLEV